MEKQPFECEVNGQKYRLIGGCAIVLFRNLSPANYIAIQDEDKTVKGYNNPDLCFWMAGYKLEIGEDDEIHRPTVTCDDETFRTQHGWSPIVIEKEEPDDNEQAEYTEVVTAGIDEEWLNGFS